jgi:hypothetical protein
VPNQWICDGCLPDAVELGQLAPGYWLALFPKGARLRFNAKLKECPRVEADTYAVIGGDGHGGKIFLTMPSRPRPDSDPHNALEEADAGFPDSMNWVAEADAWEDLSLPLDSAWAFVQSCREEGGWGKDLPHPIFHQWFFHRAGELVKEYEERSKT